MSAVILEPEGLGLAFSNQTVCGLSGRLQPVAFSATRLIVSSKIIRSPASQAYGDC